MCTGEALGIAVFGVLFGPPAAIWPYRVARWGEMLDAIGRRPAGRVEPADWNVTLTRVIGIGLTIFGVGVVASCV